MSVQFGNWNFKGQQPPPDYIEKVGAALAPYGPDSKEAYCGGNVNIFYRAFHTTEESRHEIQPHISTSGIVITWDGRLDNRGDLIGELRGSLTVSSTDVVIVAAAHEKWGTRCFAHLIGDWALSIWNPIKRCLILAIDPIGTHHLYYSIGKDQVVWSTILDPLVLLAGKTFAVNEEYIAGWFSDFPAAHLTPYAGIHAVPPSSSVLLRAGKDSVNKYWDFDPCRKIRYRTDAEYEEQFRTVLTKAVQRRLRSDRPVLAELSGGMDSSSIVCVADAVIARETPKIPRLDTISYYNDFDPILNERPYFTKVEERRGRVGCHIDLSTQRSLEFDFESDRFAPTPSYGICESELLQRYEAYMRSQGHRVVLCGIGGDEALGGGVPTPRPELQDLLARARLLTLARQLNAWAMKMKKSRLPLLWEATRGFFPAPPRSASRRLYAIPWFSAGFVRRNRTALCAYPSRVRLFGPLPSFQHNARSLAQLRRQLAHFSLEPEMLRDLRYPYLDRDLLEFVYGIPREQIVRVGQRRSLMRRALVGIVPDELLNRKRKAFVRQEFPKGSSILVANLALISQLNVSDSLGLIDRDRFLQALQKVRDTEELPMGNLTRTLELEFWLRRLTVRGILANSTSTKKAGPRPRESERLRAPTQDQKFS
jgi:asparagine synthase (glutamine-hydrolysing)